MHPRWQYRFWTDEANRAFIAEHYPAFLPTYDAYSYNIQRADAVRYCLLHHYGGVYVDMDIECLQPLDSLIAGRDFLVVLEPDEQGAWLGKTSLASNAFMAARPGHPFLEAVIERLMQDPSPGLTHRDVLATTGPLMLDAALAEYSGQDVTVLPSHVAFPYPVRTPELERLRIGDAEALKASLVDSGTYAVHYWANSWVGTLAGELINPDPASIEGFDFFPGVDSPGHDITNVGRDIPRAALACRQIKEAVAFNTDGFVKRELLPVHRWLPMGNGATNEGLYVRKRGGISDALRRLFSRR